MQSGAKNVCKRPVAPEGALQPLLTVVVRTDKLNGQVGLARRLAFHCCTCAGFSSASVPYHFLETIGRVQNVIEAGTVPS